MLALARFGIAISSAGCSPAAYSLISDLFPARRRGTAIAIYSLGISIGTWAGLTLGGLIEDHFGWRAAFIAIGTPGLLLALLFMIFVREPVRGRYDAHNTDNDRQYSLREAFLHFVKHPAFLSIALGFALLSFSTSAFETWVPTYLIREHGLSSTEVGSISGLAQGLTAIFGTLIFGIMADRLSLRDRRWYLWIPIASFVLSVPAILIFFQVPTTWSYVCYFFTELCVSAYSAPLFAASQMLLPPRLRALGMATVLFVLNVIGMGFGPFLTGWASDLIGGSGAAGGLGAAIMLMQAGGLIGVLALLNAARHLKKA